MAEEKFNRILVVDDESSLRFVLSRGLTRKGYVVDAASTVAEAGEFLNEYPYFLAFVDIMMPDGSGLDLLESIKRRPNAPSVVVMTAEATMKNAIEAMQKGAFDYLTKPFDLNEVALLAQRVGEYRKMAGELAQLKSAEPVKSSPDEIIGRAPSMQDVFKLIGRAANSDATVLITGPTGSGKELVARALHQNSARAREPFITVNCAAIPHDLLESELFGHVKGAFTGAVEDQKGKFLAANGGAILLDEVGEMPLSLQAKMLRVLQEREFYPVGATRPVKIDVRVIASTNRNLATEVAEGKFREDLYHRLNVVRIALPPLSERLPDIPALARHFLSKIARTFNEKQKMLAPAAMDALTRYNWPGNVRELENVIRRGALMAPGDTITVEDLPPEITGAKDGRKPEESLSRLTMELMESAPEGQVYDTVISLVEKTLIEHALKKADGVQTHAAKLLGVNRNTLMKKIGEYHIKAEE
ncbi:MAG: sigma-54-dependent Fis family transcriptional regulator [Nitrospinae bacterium]|nr:sigma-54-dependent Fis family transcriptional regulator [Nitrospinota bacterium]